jgi:hypothetical protein
LTTVERITAAGGDCYAVQEGFDVTTEGGRLGVRIMLALAQFDFERTSAAWRMACEHAISRGLYFGGTPGMGYRKLRSGRLCPNPQTAEIIPELVVGRPGRGHDAPHLGLLLGRRDPRPSGVVVGLDLHGHDRIVLKVEEPAEWIATAVGGHH